MAITENTGKVTEVGVAERKRIQELYADVINPRKGNRLNDWEVSFVKSLYQGSSWQGVTWTPKQVDTLGKIEAKYYAAG